MITLRKMGDLIFSKKSGGDPSYESQYDVREIMLFIRQVMNEVLMPVIFQKMDAGDRSIIPMYIATYPGITIKHDKTAKVRYSDIPEFWIGLPYGKGIQIHPDRDPHDVWIRKNNASVESHLLAGYAFGKQTYRIEGMKAVYDKGTKGTANVEAVTMKLLIAAPDSVADTDPLPILPSQQAEIERRVMVLIDQETIRDTSNDGVDEGQLAKVAAAAARTRRTR